MSESIKALEEEITLLREENAKLQEELGRDPKAKLLHKLNEDLQVVKGKLEGEIDALEVRM